MYAGDVRLNPVKVRFSTRTVLAWTMWTKGYMSPKTAIRTFFAKAA
jgi:hypothetical protein